MYSGELRNGSREICRGVVWFQEDSTFSLKTWKSMTLHKRDISFILNDGFSLSRDLRQLFLCYLFLDCEQSLFFFRFSKRAISLAPSVTRHQSRAISLAPSVTRHQSRAWPFACLAFCSTDYRKKRDCS